MPGLPPTVYSKHGSRSALCAHRFRYYNIVFKEPLQSSQARLSYRFKKCDERLNEVLLPYSYRRRLVIILGGHNIWGKYFSRQHSGKW